MQTAQKPSQPHSHVTLNKVISHLLQSPLHGLLSHNLLLITFTGRKTGQEYTIPVTFNQRSEKITVFSNQNWWRNLEGGAPVTLQLRGRQVQAQAEVSRDTQVIIEELTAFFLQRGVKSAWMINVSGLAPNRAPTEEELTTIAQTHVVVSVTPRQSGHE